MTCLDYTSNPKCCQRMQCLAACSAAGCYAVHLSRRVHEWTAVTSQGWRVSPDDTHLYGKVGLAHHFSTSIKLRAEIDHEMPWHKMQIQFQAWGSDLIHLQLGAHADVHHQLFQYMICVYGCDVSHMAFNNDPPIYGSALSQM